MIPRSPIINQLKGNGNERGNFEGLRRVMSENNAFNPQHTTFSTPGISLKNFSREIEGSSRLRKFDSSSPRVRNLEYDGRMRLSIKSPSEVNVRFIPLQRVAKVVPLEQELEPSQKTLSPVQNISENCSSRNLSRKQINLEENRTSVLSKKNSSRKSFQNDRTENWSFWGFLKKTLLVCIVPEEDIYSILDSEAKKKVDSIRFSKKYIQELYNIFRQISYESLVTIEYNEYLEYIEVERNAFTEFVFKLGGPLTTGSLTFSSFIFIVLTYCLYSKEELLFFCFKMCDLNESGKMDENEFKKLISMVKSLKASFPGNFQKVREEFDINQDGLIDFDEFRELDKRYPLLLFPAFQLQDVMQKKFLGEKAWIQILEDIRKKELIEEFERLNGGQRPSINTIRKIMLDRRKS